MQISYFAVLCLSVLPFTQGHALRKRTSRLSSPDGCLIVQGQNPTSGEFATLGAAVGALGSGKTPQCIFVYPGHYNEQVTVKYGGNLTIYGYTDNVGKFAHNTVTITSSQSSAQAGTLDASSAVNFVNNGVRVYNLNFTNSYSIGHQAVAVTANGNYQGFYGCSFLGNQDTLYAKAGQQYYKSCYIEGSVDYIFGNAAAWFGACTIRSNGPGYITANSRQTTNDNAWYVFDKCTIDAVPNALLAGKVFLGRPWRALARVIYQNSVLSDIINPAGWTTMAANATPIFEEYNNNGAGADTAERLYETLATAAVSKKLLWQDDYNSWIDSLF